MLGLSGVAVGHFVDVHLAILSSVCKKNKKMTTTKPTALRVYFFYSRLAALAASTCTYPAVFIV